MKRTFLWISVFLCYMTVLCAADDVTQVSEGVASELMRELFLDKSYETGLSLDGETGFFITTATESVFEGGLLAGGNLVHERIEINGETTRSSTFSAVAAYGVSNELFGPFKNLEVSGQVPIVYMDKPNDTVIGLGDIKVSAKVGLLDEDPFRPSVPSLSFVASVYLPTGGDDVEYVESFGMEFGAVLGKTFSDSSSEVDFKVYLELLGSYITYDGEDDFFIKGNLALGFPLMGVKNTYITAEYGMISRSDAHLEDGDILVIGVRYQTEKFNAAVGINIRDYDDQDIKNGSVFLAYEMKF